MTCAYVGVKNVIHFTVLHEYHRIKHEHKALIMLLKLSLALGIT